MEVDFSLSMWEGQMHHTPHRKSQLSRSRMSSVVISRSLPVIVKPSEPVTATGDITLSFNDMMTGPTQVTALFVFERPMQEPIETMKRGLKRALIHYYPMAGCLAAGANAGEVVIKCTGQGVPFIAASANCALKDIPDMYDPSLQEELAVFYAAATETDMFRYSQPLMRMQVTVFSCGGFVVGVTWLHAVADGVGMGQFMQAVGELARGLPSPSVVPVRSVDSLTLAISPFSPHMMEIIRTLALHPQPSPLTLLNVTIKSSLIDGIKRNHPSTTVFKAVTAVLWRCRTRAVMSDPEALTAVQFGANARGTRGGVRDGYYGNSVALRLVMATSGAIANGDIVDLVKMIQRGKDREPDRSDVDALGKVEWHNFLGITSWRNIGFEAPDFGAGTPARVMAHWRRRPLPYCTVCTPCRDDDCYHVLAICVDEEHGAAFLHELANVHRMYK